MGNQKIRPLLAGCVLLIMLPITLFRSIDSLSVYPILSQQFCCFRLLSLELIYIFTYILSTFMSKVDRSVKGRNDPSVGLLRDCMTATYVDEQVDQSVKK